MLYFKRVTRKERKAGKRYYARKALARMAYIILMLHFNVQRVTLFV
jgi:hypothetical protein